jgi:hypothetical protein
MRRTSRRRKAVTTALARHELPNGDSDEHLPPQAMRN